MKQRDMIFLLVGICAVISIIYFVLWCWPLSEGMRIRKRTPPTQRPRPSPKREMKRAADIDDVSPSPLSLSDPSIQYCVIHVESNTFRDQNIIDQQEVLGQPIFVFDAVDGTIFKGVKNVEEFIRKEYDSRFVDDYSHRKKHINEIACYMSHAGLVRSIVEGKNGAADYTVIFEDDFKIIGGSNLHAHVQRILRIMEREDPDFDMVFLGTVNSGRGVSLEDDIYHFNTMPGLVVYGAHAYIINNKKADKIYEELLEINDVVDIQYFNGMREGRLKGYVVEPMLVRQQNEKFGTTVRL